MTYTSTTRRFATIKAEPSRVMPLDISHPAIRDNHTLFRKSVVHPDNSPRLLVSGYNNRKLGRTIKAGNKRGMHIFHLTLEERATCPRSCLQYQTCYGDAMPFSRRHDVTDFKAFGIKLQTEISVLNAKQPNGFMLRLHTLGDFFSRDYVDFWEFALAKYPALNAFGYTARTCNEIGEPIKRLANKHWDRFAIRLSTDEPVPQSAVVLQEPAKSSDVIMCPAQTGASECCATCGLCWNEAARDKSIGFMQHGRKRRGKTLI